MHNTHIMPNGLVKNNNIKPTRPGNKLIHYMYTNKQKIKKRKEKSKAREMCLQDATRAIYYSEY